MAIIPSLLKAIVSRLTPRIKSPLSSFTRALTKVASFGARRQGHPVKDITETLEVANIEPVVPELHQTVLTTTRMLDTESAVISWDRYRTLPRNLVVSGRVRSGKNFWTFYQADIIAPDGEYLGRRWMSMQSNTLKPFAEMEDSIYDAYNKAKYPDGETIENISYHHVIHKRGAEWLFVDPK